MNIITYIAIYLIIAAHGTNVGLIFLLVLLFTVSSDVFPNVSYLAMPSTSFFLRLSLCFYRFFMLKSVYEYFNSLRNAPEHKPCLKGRFLLSFVMGFFIALIPYNVCKETQSRF
jgi:hypothetical protein